MVQDRLLFKETDGNGPPNRIFSYRYGQASHSDQLRDAKKIKFYIDAEIDRLSKLQ